MGLSIERSAASGRTRRGSTSNERRAGKTRRRFASSERRFRKTTTRFVEERRGLLETTVDIPPTRRRSVGPRHGGRPRHGGNRSNQRLGVYTLSSAIPHKLLLDAVSCTRTYWAVTALKVTVVSADPVPVATGGLHVKPSLETLTAYALP